MNRIRVKITDASDRYPGARGQLATLYDEGTLAGYVRPDAPEKIAGHEGYIPAHELELENSDAPPPRWWPAALAIIVLLLTLAAPATARAGLTAPTKLLVPAFTSTVHATAAGGGILNVADYENVAGWLGLCPTGQNWQGVQCPTSHGEVTFWWYDDAAGTQIAGVQGLPLTSLIPSNALLNIPNQGDYLRVEFECFPRGSACPFGMRLRGTHRGARMPLAAPDTMLAEEEAKTLPTSGCACSTVYPADYYAGPMHVFLDAPPGVTVTVYTFNLELVARRSASFGPGTTETRAPFGGWFLFVSGPAGAPYTLTVTPDAGSGVAATRAATTASAWRVWTRYGR